MAQRRVATKRFGNIVPESAKSTTRSRDRSSSLSRKQKLSISGWLGLTKRPPMIFPATSDSGMCSPLRTLWCTRWLATSFNLSGQSEISTSGSPAAPNPLLTTRQLSPWGSLLHARECQLSAVRSSEARFGPFSYGPRRDVLASKGASGHPSTDRLAATKDMKRWVSNSCYRNIHPYSLSVPKMLIWPSADTAQLRIAAPTYVVAALTGFK